MSTAMCPVCRKMQPLRYDSGTFLQHLVRRGCVVAVCAGSYRTVADIESEAP